MLNGFAILYEKSRNFIWFFQNKGLEHKIQDVKKLMSFKTKNSENKVRNNIQLYTHLTLSPMFTVA